MAQMLSHQQGQSCSRNGAATETPVPNDQRNYPPTDAPINLDPSVLGASPLRSPTCFRCQLSDGLLSASEVAHDLIM